MVSQDPKDLLAHLAYYLGQQVIKEFKDPQGLLDPQVLMVLLPIQDHKEIQVQQVLQDPQVNQVGMLRLQVQQVHLVGKDLQV
jgi:hypothetical protein